MFCMWLYLQIGGEGSTAGGKNEFCNDKRSLIFAVHAKKKKKKNSIDAAN